MLRLCFCLLLQTLSSALMPLAWSICTIFNLLSSPFFISTGFSHSSSQGYLLDLSVFFSAKELLLYLKSLKHEHFYHLKVKVIQIQAEDIRLTFPDVFWGNIEIPRPLLTLFCKNCEIKNILGKSQIRFLSKGLCNILCIYQKITKILHKNNNHNDLTPWTTVCSSVNQNSSRSN